MASGSVNQDYGSKDIDSYGHKDPVPKEIFTDLQHRELHTEPGDRLRVLSPFTEYILFALTHSPASFLPRQNIF
jgi:hypothetical protein